jgi:hypothetical protein
MLWASCGYRWAVPNSRLPGSVRSVAVPVFSNRTAEPTVEVLFTEAMREQLQRAGRLASEGAEAELLGTIALASAGPMMGSRGAGQFPVYRLTAVVELVLKKNGAVLWQTTAQGSEDFPSGADVLLTESNRGAAMRRLSEWLMHDAAEQLGAAGMSP